jgi:putative membrane protein
MGHEHFWMDGTVGFPGLIFLIIMIICFILCVRGCFRSAWWCAKDRWNQRSNENSEASLEILKKRYARGEITQEEYSQMQKILLG